MIIARPPCTGHWASEWTNDWTGEAFKIAISNELQSLRNPHRAVIVDNGKDDMMSAHELTVLTEIAPDEDPALVCEQLDAAVKVVCAEAPLCSESGLCSRSRRSGYATPPDPRVYTKSITDTFLEYFQKRADNHGFINLGW